MTENRLGQETSPYLLQHQDNPVHWWPWGPEALAEASATGKPILLSVGYAACHWCHVMAHESFEDEATAAVMNELFVNIKVDREERPDIDQIYMAALHALGQQGGWPLTMFLDSAARPFWGGTYFPPRPQWGRPAFVDILREVARIYRAEPEKVAMNGAALTKAVVREPETVEGLSFDDAMLARLARQAATIVDMEKGGIRGAPKFPQWSFFWFLWRAAIRYDDATAREGVLVTLRNIGQGGIYDHLGGGFARYSVDENWLVPHFEKMLYDNALLIDLMTEAWRETKDPLFATRIEETIDWVAREMIADGGGFAASLDADSEGEEGKFYVWSLTEILDVLGEADGAVFAATYDVQPDGNFEGHTILNRLGRQLPGTTEEEKALAVMRAKLLARRSKRIRPGWDDKVLADWNGLAIAAIARASAVFARPDWLALASNAFAFVEERMTIDGRLRHAARAGKTSAPATSADYANMIWGAIRLYETTLDPRYLRAAESWSEILERHYRMPEGGYATSADDTADVIVRIRSAADDAVPNANATMITNLMSLFSLTGDPNYRTRASELVAAFSGHVAKSALRHAGVLAAVMDALSPSMIVVATQKTPSSIDNDLADELHHHSMPGAVEVCASDDQLAKASSGLTGKPAVGSEAAAYVCIGESCAPPATQRSSFEDILRSTRRADLNSL
ncbi:MAG: thioredoxin domain-containing protein [Hyphomicrobium sp.]|nr:thioredoxin domain-containing protein [Hyphomicrobium sp.]